MAKTSQKNAKKIASFWTNFILIVICIIWLVPIFGHPDHLLQAEQDIFTSGWWKSSRTSKMWKWNELSCQNR